MTKERRLAIQMWTNIRNMLSASDVCTRSDIVAYKLSFCTRYDLNWKCNCWFCMYMPSCSECPLGCCSDGLYGIVLANYKEKNVRIEACNGIIKALGGKA